MFLDLLIFFLRASMQNLIRKLKKKKTKKSFDNILCRRRVQSYKIILSSLDFHKIVTLACNKPTPFLRANLIGPEQSGAAHEGGGGEGNASRYISSCLLQFGQREPIYRLPGKIGAAALLSALDARDYRFRQSSA